LKAISYRHTIQVYIDAPLENDNFGTTEITTEITENAFIFHHDTMYLLEGFPAELLRICLEQELNDLNNFLIHIIISNNLVGIGEVRCYGSRKPTI
jgi:hypothetical protein